MVQINIAPINGKRERKTGFMPDFARSGIESKPIIVKTQRDKIQIAYRGNKKIFLPDNIGIFSLNFSIPFNLIRQTAMHIINAETTEVSC